MPDFFWSTKNQNGQDVRCEGGEVVHVDPKSMSAIAGDAGNFVWMPGAVQQGNVFSNWPDLAAAIAALPGQKTVTVDTSLGAAHITTGNYAGISSVSFQAGDATGVLVIVHIDDGAHFTYAGNVQTRLSFDGVAVDVGNTTAAFISAGGSQTFEFFFEHASSLSCSGTKAFIDFAGTSQMVCWVETDSLIETGTIDPFNVSGGTPTLDFFALTGGVLQQSIIAASGGAGVVAFAIDGSSQGSASLSQSIAPVVTVFDPLTDFVFRPGGTAGGNVFTNWTALMNAVSLTPGAKTIVVDDSLGAANTQVGTWNLDGCTLIALLPTGATGTLNVIDGTHFTASQLIIAGNLTVSGAGASAIIALTAGQTLLLQVKDGAVLQSTTATAFITKAAGAALVVECNLAAQLGDGTHPAISSTSGTTTVFATGQTSVLAHAYAGAGTVNTHFDQSSSVSTTQDVTTFTLTYAQAPNFVQAAANTGTGTGTSSAQTGNLARKKSGKVDVQGTATGIINANGTVTVSLLRDATPILALPALTVLSTTAFSIPIFFTDTLPDNNNHTYSVQAVADGAHTITTGAGGNVVRANELS